MLYFETISNLMHGDTKTSEKGLTPTGLVWDTNMATSLFFGGTIMVDVTTSEYALCQNFCIKYSLAKQLSNSVALVGAKVGNVMAFQF